MVNFFQELSTKLAERWVGLLAVPGALFAGAAWAGWHLGWRHAVDLPALVRHGRATGAEIALLPAPTQVLLVVATALGVSAVALAVQALAAVTRAVWLGDWPARISRPVVSWRRRRWDGLVQERQHLEQRHPAAERTAADQHAIDRAAARITRLSPARPGRPTWIGDRGHAVEQVALDRYGLDLTYGWPRLWLVLPEPARAEITAAHAAFVAAVAAASWAWPYLLLAVAWWPAAVIGVAIGVTGWVRGRGAAGELATLSEAAVDLHGRALAVALGVAGPDTAGPLSPPEGAAVTAIVRKGR
jgi:hypothetical protein